jgi:hypothetical protein
MHLNEIKITEQNREQLMEEATRLGERHVAALQEQIERQNAKQSSV